MREREGGREGERKGGRERDREREERGREEREGGRESEREGGGERERERERERAKLEKLVRVSRGMEKKQQRQNTRGLWSRRKNTW